MPASLPTVLLANDDGIDSPLLPPLIEVLAPVFELFIAVPASEQSWIGRAMTRREAVSCDATTIAGHAAWALGGTPTDCVNIALGHLLPKQPDLVISGINIGYNTTVPLIYSSGTVAAALEGANWQLPAIAASQALPPGIFRHVSGREGELPDDVAATVTASAQATANFAQQLLAQGTAAPDALTVHNLNFPHPYAGGPLIRTHPAQVQRGSLYAREGDDAFRFAYQEGTVASPQGQTDLETLQAGQASHSILNFGQLGKV